jgi:hypothetical protein
VRRSVKPSLAVINTEEVDSTTTATTAAVEINIDRRMEVRPFGRWKSPLIRPSDEFTFTDLKDVLLKKCISRPLCY